MTWDEIPSTDNLPIEEIVRNYSKEVVLANLVKQYEETYTIVIPKDYQKMDDAFRLLEKDTIELVANKSMDGEKIWCENIYTEPNSIYGYHYYDAQKQYKILLPKGHLYTKTAFRADYSTGLWVLEIFYSFKNKIEWNSGGLLSEPERLKSSYEEFKKQVSRITTTYDRCSMRCA